MLLGRGSKPHVCRWQATDILVNAAQVAHIIVCGHYDCNGVNSALESDDLGSPLEDWITNIRDVYRTHKDEMDSIRDMTKRKRRLVELNVIEQALNVHKAAVVQRRRVFTSIKEGLATPKVG